MAMIDMVHEAVATLIELLRSLDTHHQYGLPFLLVGVLALLWFTPGLLARAVGKLIYCLSNRALKGVASTDDAVLESGPEGNDD